MNELAAWILSIMTVWSPPTRPHYIPEAQESHDQALARYREIALSIVEAVDKERPIFRGKLGREKTALLVAYVWWQESGFRRDIDLGLGRERLAEQGYNDRGRSWCMGQLNLGRRRVPIVRDGTTVQWRWESARMTVEGWTGTELLQDRVLCARATLNALRRGILACKGLPPADRLAAYHSGTCDSERGRHLSRIRWRLFWRQFAKHAPRA